MDITINPGGIDVNATVNMTDVDLTPTQTHISVIDESIAITLDATPIYVNTTHPLINISVLPTTIDVSFAQMGLQGPAGIGIPIGGTTGQVLSKLSASDYDTQWNDIASGDSAWGGITGTLEDQSDLQSALDLKANSADLAIVANSGDYNDLINTPILVTDHGALTGLSDDDHTQYHTDTRALAWLATRSTSDVSEGSNLYYTEGRVSANSNVAANTAARHNPVTIGTANGLSLSTQQLSLGLSSSTTTGALSNTDWALFNGKQAALTLGNITGTTNQVTVSGGTGAIIGAGVSLSLPQNIHTSANPAFSTLTLGAVTGHINTSDSNNLFDVDIRNTVTLNSDGMFRFGRGTDTGSGTLYSYWYVGNDSSTAAMRLNHKTSELLVNGAVHSESLIINPGTARQECTIYANGIGDSYLQMALVNSAGSAGMEFVAQTDRYEIQANATGDWLLYHRTDSSYIFYYDESLGNLAIGNFNTPVARAHIRLSASGQTILLAGTALALESGGANYLSFMADSNEPSTHGVVWSDADDILVSALLYQHSTERMYVYANNQYRMCVDSTGQMKIAQGATSATGGSQLEIETTTTFAGACLLLDQNDTDQPFIALEGTGAANVTNSISTSGAGASGSSASAPNSGTWTQTEMMKVSYNGAVRYIPLYTPV